MNANKIPLVGAFIQRLRRRSDHEGVKMAMASKGDVTKVEHYKTMSECLSRLTVLDSTSSGSLGKTLRTANRTHALLLKRKSAFTTAFSRNGSESMRLIYVNTVLALWHTVSLLCAEGVVFVKSANGTFLPVANRLGADNLAASVIVTRLERFCDIGEKFGGFEQTMTETAIAIERETLTEAIGLLTGAALAVTGIVALLMLARDLAEKFYTLRGTFARWLEVQSSYLQMNAAAVNKGVSRTRQEEYAAKLTAIAERIRIDDIDTEKTSVRAIEVDDRSIEAESDGKSANSGHQTFATTLL